MRQRTLWVALDVPTREAAVAKVLALAPLAKVLPIGFKVGKQLFTATGPELVRFILAQGFKVFLDLKFHDIPNTMAGAAISAANLGVDMFNVHASAGPEGLAAVAEAMKQYEADNGKRPRVTAVTMLTSHKPNSPSTNRVYHLDLLDKQMLEDAGFTPLEFQVYDFAMMAADAGLDGVVCSPQELKMLRRMACDLPANFLKVNPGIRMPDAPPDDQARTMSPAEAAAAGATDIVVGRPILQAEDPLAAAQAIYADFTGAGVPAGVM